MQYDNLLQNLGAKKVPPRAFRTRLDRQQNVDSDHFERLNFGHQLALLMRPIHPGLARFYTREFRTVARRTVIRLGQRVRGTYCRNCFHCTADVRRRVLKTGRRSSFVLSRCAHCGQLKRFLNRKQTNTPPLH